MTVPANYGTEYSLNEGDGVALRLCNGLSCDDPGFDLRCERCCNQTSHPSQGTVNKGDLPK